LEVMHMDAKRGRALHEDENALFNLTTGIRELVGRVAAKRRRLVEIEGTDLDKLEEKREVLSEVEQDTELARLLADLTAGTALAYAGRGATGLDTASNLAVEAARKAMSGDETAVLAVRDQLDAWLRTDQPEGAFDRRPIHWPLAFPEVFERGGFDAIIGNPPYLGGQKLTGAFGAAYRKALVLLLGDNVRGSADLVAYFLLRVHCLLNTHGQTGLIMTNTVAQGATREVGIDRLV